MKSRAHDVAGAMIDGAKEAFVRRLSPGEGDVIRYTSHPFSFPEATKPGWRRTFPSIAGFMHRGTVYWFIPDTLREASDTLREVPDTLREVPDTLREVPDTLREVPDTLREVPDTLREIPDTLREVSGTVGNSP